MHPKTTRFASETATAARIQSVANVRGICIDLVQAHEAWAEHSDDYCASWLCWRDEDPTNEILQALTKWEGRHGMARRIPTPVPVADFSNIADQPTARTEPRIHG